MLRWVLFVMSTTFSDMALIPVRWRHKDFPPGIGVRVTGTIHNLRPGVVIEWEEGFGHYRPGLIPVFLPAFASTYFWWMAPHNLIRTEFRKLVIHTRQNDALIEVVGEARWQLIAKRDLVDVSGKSVHERAWAARRKSK